MEQKKRLKFKSINLYNKFIGFLTKKGNRTTSKYILDKTLELVSKKVKKSPKVILLLLFLKLNVYIEIKKVKIRNRSYTIPFSLSLKRRSYLIIKWILASTKQNKKKDSFINRLAFEIVHTLTTSKSKTLLLKKINNSQAFLNRSNSHFRW